MADNAHIQHLEDGDGKYMVVNLVARRARDLNKRKLNTLYDETTPDPTDTAMTEYQNGHLNWEFRHDQVGRGEDYRSN